MLIGERLRELREVKELSQGDIETRSGLLRCYISRVENGHTVPSVETLEKMARALEVPIYQFFFDGLETPVPLKLRTDRQPTWGATGKDAAYLFKLRRLLGRMSNDDRNLFLHMAQKVGNRRDSNGHS